METLNNVYNNNKRKDYSVQDNQNLEDSDNKKRHKSSSLSSITKTTLNVQQQLFNDKGNDDRENMRQMKQYNKNNNNTNTKTNTHNKSTNLDKNLLKSRDNVNSNNSMNRNINSNINNDNNSKNKSNNNSNNQRDDISHKRSIPQADKTKKNNKEKVPVSTRRKEEREALPGNTRLMPILMLMLILMLILGFTCEHCVRWFRSRVDTGIITEDQYEDHLKECCRHKFKEAPINTPPGMWDLTIPSPTRWTKKY